MVISMIYFADELITVKNRIIELLAEKEHITVAFDGRSAAGKSMAAEYLAKELDGEVIHMDDFFLPPEMRTEQRLGEPGGNVHRERFADEVLIGLRSGKIFEYRFF